MNHPDVSVPQELGTREDPYAQARQSRSQPLLLHSMALFREIFAAIFAHRDIATVVEIGVESGQVSGMYVELGASTVHCIEPHPTAEMRANLAANDALHLVEDSSPEALETLPAADLYVIDGDHNYATVSKELDWIMTHAPDSVVVLHDVLWPCSRRDLYYQPSELSVDEMQPAGDDGPTVWHDAMTPAGFVGHGTFTAAREAGGERNGVLTAVEDALAHTRDDPWHLAIIPAVFGIGVMACQSAPTTTDVIAALRPYTTSALLAAMENNRIALYTHVLQLQYEAAAHADDADQLATTLSTQSTELDKLKSDLENVHASYDDQLQQLRQENQRLERELADQEGRPHNVQVLKDVLYLATLWPREKWNAAKDRRR